MDKTLYKKVTLVYTLLIVIISLIPIPDFPIPEFKLFELDKFIHLSMYYVMSIMWIRLDYFNESSFPFKSLLLVFIIASLTEFLQGVLPIGRYSDWADFIANSTGILIGILTYRLYFSKNKWS
ncbi:MAG: VanZ family protein [Flavobacteriaceae bacterium]|nr:VanZ family protein [Flavobacteriaceae bacterium]MBT5857764.1 VanZ family protein [Flavobacteriaceae bacterium]MBT6688866.1 VanZ family protein [Flavobacteriaceae bacterium]